MSATIEFQSPQRRGKRCNYNLDVARATLSRVLSFNPLRGGASAATEALKCILTEEASGFNPLRGGASAATRSSTF